MLPNHVKKATLEDNVVDVVDFQRQDYRGCKRVFRSAGFLMSGRNPEGDVRFVQALRSPSAPMTHWV